MSYRISRGFTLVELVIVMVITGIIAATLVVFVKPAVDSYTDARRRASMTDIADTALRRMGRDVRLAVPNSVRSPDNQCFELLPTIAGGRYRMAPDTVNDGGANCAPSDTCSAPLDVSQPSTGFDVLSPLSVIPSAGDWVVIGNQNTNDVYAGTNRAGIAAVSTPPIAYGAHRISFSSTQFPGGYDGGRFTVVSNNGGNPAVFYVCSGADGNLDAQGNGKGTLFRVTRPFSGPYPSVCPDTTGAAILATHVKSCNLVYDPNQGATQQSGFVWMQLELTDANETVSLSYGAHVSNAP